MQGQLKKARSDTDETRQALESLRAQLDRAYAELLQQRSLISGYQAEIADLNAQISQWRQQSTEWEARTHALEKISTELEQTEAESLHKQRTIAYLQTKVRDVGSILRETADHLRSVAKTKPYRLAHFFRRVERDVIKGSREERLHALRWLRRRLVGRQTPRQEAKNPLLDDAALILQARETLDVEVLAFDTALQRGPQSCYDVICFSAIQSTARVERPRQVMAQFAAAGHRVFYISQHFRPEGLPYELVEIATNTYQVSLRTRHNVHTDSLNDEARDDLFAALDTLRCEQGSGAKVTYVQLPFWRPLVERLRNELNWPVVYDCVGFHAGSLANGHGRLGDEDALLELSDLLIVSSLVGETARRQRSPRQLLLCAPRDHDQLVQVAPQPSEIAAALQQTNDEQRQALAREQSLENRFADLNGAICATFPLTSIIIVTFNNLSLNRLCLRTLYAYTDWPNFEVIVVDNGSTDGTREYLKEAERQFSQLRVVFNGANLGFARANNIGLQKARGEYLVLLNNDTVVVQGWLSALIRHLVADQTIGLIGPVTNETVNEAKVPVGYQQLDEMPAWAMEFTRAHDAHTFDIPMLAMFCVAMRRATFAEIGPLDEQFGIGMFEDDDYSLRMKMGGYRVVCAADAFVHHFGCASFKKLKESEAYHRLFTENRQRYEAKWNVVWTPHQQGALKLASESRRTGLTRR